MAVSVFVMSISPLLRVMFRVLEVLKVKARSVQDMDPVIGAMTRVVSVLVNNIGMARLATSLAPNRTVVSS